MSQQSNFLSWLMEDINQVEAEAGTSRDRQLKKFEDQGFLKYAFSAHGTNTYLITSMWLHVIPKPANPAVPSDQ